MSDEGFHEIQLNGKQLVFLFITVTVVSVVIFLCGVLVGRGVRAERADAAVESAVAPVSSTPEPVAQGASDPAASGQAPPATAANDPAAAAPPPADDELSYYKRLEGENPPKETLKPQAPASAAAAPAAPPPAPPASQSAAPAKTAAAPPESGDGGLAVQVAALRDKNEADAIVQRLTGKGYHAYLVNAQAGAVATFKVRVGNYKTEREAETVKTRLEKEEQFKPWIVR